MRGAQGFTLLELLVVAALVAILSATAVIGLRGVGVDPLEREARRLVGVWNQLCEETAIDARPLGITLSADSYQGVQPGREKRWRGTPGTSYAFHSLPAGMRIELVDAGTDAQPGEGLAETPQLLCLPGGLSQGPTLRMMTANDSRTIVAEPDSGQRQLAGSSESGS